VAGRLLLLLQLLLLEENAFSFLRLFVEQGFDAYSAGF
jgi:hypothetical protein